MAEINRTAKKHKNTVKGTKPRKRYPPEVVRAVLADYILLGDIVAVAKKHKVPESTIRTWKKKAQEKDGETLSGYGSYSALRHQIEKEINERAALSAGRTMEHIARRTALGFEDYERINKLRAEALEAIEKKDMAKLEEITHKLEIVQVFARPIDIITTQSLFNLFYLHGVAEMQGEKETAGAVQGLDVVLFRDK